jgi:hypothetical protein
MLRWSGTFFFSFAHHPIRCFIKSLFNATLSISVRFDNSNNNGDNIIMVGSHRTIHVYGVLEIVVVVVEVV